MSNDLMNLYFAGNTDELMNTNLLQLRTGKWGMERRMLRFILNQHKRTNVRDNTKVEDYSKQSKSISDEGLITWEEKIKKNWQKKLTERKETDKGLLDAEATRSDCRSTS